MARKLNKGERVRKDGRFEYRYRDKLGRNISIYATSLEELRQKEEQILLFSYKGPILNTKNILLNDLFNLWCKNKRGLKPNTFSNYKYMYTKYVYDTFGKNKIKDLLKSDIKSFYLYLYEEKNMAVSTIDVIHNVIHQVIDVAIDDDIIRYNPSDKALKELKTEARKTGKAGKKRVGLTKEEEAIFFEFLESSVEFSRWLTVFKFLARTGLRSGEFAALQKEDVSFKTKSIYIDKTAAQYCVDVNGPKKTKSMYEIHSPKTPSGHRTIPLTDELEKIVKDELEYQEYAGIKCTDKLNGFENFLFVNSKGSFFKDSAINKVLDRIVNNCNEQRATKYGVKDTLFLPRITCHTFRHTFNSRLEECGIMVEDRMALLGHTDPGVNISVYTHVSDDKKLQAMKRYEEFIAVQYPILPKNDPKKS